MTQDLIPVKPSTDWGLNRGGAHCQWPRGLVSASLVANDNATSLATGVRPAATRDAADVHRGCATGGGWTREGHQKVARTRPHLAGCTRGHGGAGDDGGEHFRGGRSSGWGRDAAAALERASGVERHPPGGARSVSVPLVRAGEARECGLAGHGGRRPRVTSGLRLEGGSKQGGQRGNAQGLTVSSKRGSACSGRRRRRRIGPAIFDARR